MMRDFCYEQTRESVDYDWEDFSLSDVANGLGVERVSCRIYYSTDNLTRRIMVFRGSTNENAIQLLTDMGFIVWDLDTPVFPIPVKPVEIQQELVQVQQDPNMIPYKYNPEGLTDYVWGAMSPSDPTQVPSKYYTREEAQQHADNMNKRIDTWEENLKGRWNKDHWKVKPEPWVVKRLKND